MSFETGAGWDVSIGTTAAAANQTQFEADTYAIIGETEEIGELGDERSIISFLSLADARVRKARGAADAGDVPLTYARDPNDAGQAALIAAFAVTSSTADEFNFRVRAADGSSTPTTFYFRARVTSNRQQSVTTEGIVKRVAMLAVNTAILEVAAT